MSDRHKEALSHLTYGLGEVGGFALLTGEVGTGKTTISRCLMEQLPDNTQAAFILNPTLSCQELLATLCDQLKIQYCKTDASLKNLTDKISEKLLNNHENDINTLLIIDEAQHLQPEVLEQLRLLTNLETNTKKLLQVILIGQPELQQLLQRRDLRQLAQRITARYHLMPLTKVELKQYIEHRLQVADCVRSLFDKSALAKIHQLSQGIPRLINLLCHSALMQAYNQNDSVVNKKIVIAAAERALGSDMINKPENNSDKFLVVSTAVSFIAFIALASFWWGQESNSIDELEVVNNQEKVSQKEEIKLESAQNLTNQAQKPVKQAHTYRQEDSYSPAQKNNTHLDDNSSVVNTQGGIHIVTSGDSLYSISLEYNVKMVALRKWNNILEESEIMIGDRLYVSDPQSVFVASLSNENNVQIEVLGTANSSEINRAQLVSANKRRVNNKGNSDLMDAGVNYQVTKVEGVSNDLLARFQAAIDDTDLEDQSSINSQSDYLAADNQSSNVQNKINSLSFDEQEQTGIKPLTEMSQQLQNAIPALNFEQHIYASDGEGWVNVNGRDRYEGDAIGDNIIVEKILPQQVILSFQGEKFSLPALTNW